VPRDPKLVESERRLKAAQDKARRKAIGPPLPLSDAALAQAASMGPLDLAAAAAFWRRHARPGVKRVIEATADA
jgi:hypothetical protein